MTTNQERLSEVIRSVTDGWDKPLDDQSDIPEIVNAILAANLGGPTVLPDVTRVVLLARGGIWQEHWEHFDGVLLSVQDDDRTLKVFSTGDER